VTYIPTVDEDEAQGELAQAYGAWREKAGSVSNIVKAVSLRPEVVEAYLALSKLVTGGATSLGSRREELIAVVCGAALACKVCTLAHGERLRQELGGSSEFAKRVRDDYRTAGLSAQDVAMLEYAERLTLAPGDVSEEHVDALRTVGFTDREILDIVLVTCYRNFVARIVDGLGVDLHPRYQTLDAEFIRAMTTFTPDPGGACKDES